MCFIIFRTVYQTKSKWTLNEFVFPLDDVTASLYQIFSKKSFKENFSGFLPLATNSLIYHVKKVFQSVVESSAYPNNTGKSNVCNSF